MQIDEVVTAGNFGPPSPTDYSQNNGWSVSQPESPPYIPPSPSGDEDEHMEEPSIDPPISVPASPVRQRPDRSWIGWRVLSRSQSLEHPNRSLTSYLNYHCITATRYLDTLMSICDKEENGDLDGNQDQ